MTQSLKGSMKIMEEKAAEREGATVTQIAKLSSEVKSALTPPAQTANANAADDCKALQEEVNVLKQELKCLKERSEKRENEPWARVSSLAAELQGIKSKQPVNSISTPPVPPVPPVIPLMNTVNVQSEQSQYQHQRREPPQQYAQHFRSASNRNQDDQQNPHEFQRTPPPRSARRVVVMMDSNRANIDFRRLFGSDNTQTVPCKNIVDANHQLQRGLGHQEEPTDIVVHVGTNDLDIHNAEAVAEGLNKFVLNVKSKHQSSKIHVSLLLPRNDSLQAAAQKTNRLITTSVQQTLPGVRIIQHPTIGTKHLRDVKHLDRYAQENSDLSGTQLFSKDIYKSVVGSEPTEETLAHSRRWNSKTSRNNRYKGYDQNNRYNR